MPSALTIARIRNDIKTMRANKNPEYSAAPLENDIFTWHFTIRGPEDSAYQRGIYHGRIALPQNWPLSPPDVYFYTVYKERIGDDKESGRFEINKKICLNITSYHKDEWSPSWGIDTILNAIISFMPSHTPEALGSLDLPEEECKELAIKSQTYICPKCGQIRKLVKPRE